MINPSWTKWILLSVFDHFKTKVDTNNTPLYVPSQQLPPDIAADRFEIIFIGPDYTELTKNNYKSRIVFNVATITNKSDSDPMAHYTMLGRAGSFFSNCIPLFKYGEVAGIDTQAKFSTLRLVGSVKTTDISLFDPVSQQQRSTLEAEYIADDLGN